MKAILSGKPERLLREERRLLGEVGRNLSRTGADGLLQGNAGFFWRQLLAVVGSSIYAFGFTYVMLWIINKITVVWDFSVASQVYTGGSGIEMDVYGGYRRSFGGFGLDVGCLYYH